MTPERTAYELKRNKKPKRRAYNLLRKMKARSKVSGFAPPEWSKEEILNILLYGKCARSGLKFSLDKYEKAKTNPFAPSPDRIDNTKGYTKENTQFVSWIYNVMKQDFPQEIVDTFIEALKKGASIN